MSVSQLEWLEHELHGWSTFAIVPVFALANAGVTLSSDALGGAAASALTLGVVVGLVAGKTIGISVAAWLATRAGIADLPDGVSWRQVMGPPPSRHRIHRVAVHTGLAFDDAALIDQAKVGILAASLTATALGAMLLRSRPANRDQAS